MSGYRILIAINVRWWNAEAAYALNLALGLRADGHQVWMMVNPGSPVHLKARAQDIPVITDILLDSVSPLRQLANLRRILRVVDNRKIELINSFKSNGAFLFGIVRRLRPGLCHIKTRGEARPPVRNAINRRVYSACDGIIAVGSPVRKWLQDLDLPEHQNIDTVYYGDGGLVRCPTVDRLAVRAELGIDGKAAVLTLLGRTQAVKGHRLLLEAMLALPPGSCHLLFLVKDPAEFPAELQMLERYIGENNLQARVTILGFQTDLARVLSITDLGVIPSLNSEVNCRVAVEFFSLGIPVLSFPTGTLPDIIRHGENGFLASARSVESLVEGINWFLERPERLQTCGDQAKRDFAERYTLEKMTRDTLQFYRRCCLKP